MPSVVEVVLALVLGFLLGLPTGSFLLISWVNRYTRKQAETANNSLDKLQTLLSQAQEIQRQGDPPVKVN